MTRVKWAYWMFVGIGALLISGCSSLDPEEKDFYSRNIFHPSIEPDEKKFWYSGWLDSGDN